jgi:hypothetical protein
MASYKINSRHPVDRPWLARIQINYERKEIGFFKTKKEAENAEAEYRKQENVVDFSARGKRKS